MTFIKLACALLGTLCLGAGIAMLLSVTIAIAVPSLSQTRGDHR